jgi:DNA-binding beta-propeller fold protein YncE
MKTQPIHRLSRTVFLPALACALAARPSSAETPLPILAGGRMYVSSFGSSEVKTFDRDGTYLSSFGAPGLSGTRGISVSSGGRLFVSGETSNRIDVFDLDGNPLSNFTAPGLAAPTGSAISPDDHLCVCSFSTNSIFVFGLDGSYVRTITPPGLSGPNCIAFLPDGSSFVASALNDQVLRLDPNGQLVSTFTGGGLDSPMAVAFDPIGRMFVSGGLSNNVVAFDPAGNYLFSVTDPAMNTPQGVAFDDRGHMFVSNYVGNDLLEFDSNMSFLRTITGPGVNIPRSIAFERLAPHLACRLGNVQASDGYPMDVLAVNGSAGNYHRIVNAPTGGPLAFSLAAYPGASEQPFRYVVFAVRREAGPADPRPLPLGLGETCFPTPITGGTAYTAFNTLGHTSRLGSPVVPGTPLGPGTIFTVPRLRPGLAGLRFTFQGIVLECCAGRPASPTNAVVIRIQ